MKKEKVTYASAGVDIDAGTAALEKIKGHVESTYTKQVLWGVGAFGGLFDLTEIVKGYRQPVLVQSIDGVGTKLMIATMANDHSTIGMDIVNHGCDDILCQGAKPLTFLDYVAMSRLSPEQMEQILGGMASACRAAGVAILGGETAELPGMYRENEYDVAGIVTGVVEKDEIINGKSLAPGHALIGLASSGLHTNGYTLARKVFFEIEKLGVHDRPKGLDGTVKEVLLAPHVNYAPAVLDFLKKVKVHAIAHITGGGFKDNIVRVVPDGVRAVIRRGTWPVLPVFAFIQKSADVAQEEMERAFNMGIGLVLAVEKAEEKAALDFFNARGHAAYAIGEVVGGSRGVDVTG
ncbi:MAG: phosphoribosylformylglycinamidine cyclo-ligase [Nitrospinae bacterium]|nr:phosphoribosylformylglycinamidine cyclo-ligase [Nitrospinota bacterium]